MKQSTPTRIITTDEMRELDRAAGEDFGVPGRVLMENAGRALAEEVCRLVEGGRVVVVCGSGNNGGDGLVAARHLANAGVAVEALLLNDALKGDAQLNLEAFRRLGGSVKPFEAQRALSARSGDVVIDAIFGIGLTRAPEGAFLAAIEAVRLARAAGAKVVAVDVPSGLQSDTGRPLGACVSADLTVTFAYLKRGLVLEPGATLAGRLVVADISIPRSAESHLKGPALFMLREDEIRAILPQRDAASNKGDYGHVLAIAGSPGKTGAAAMTCFGALRAGAGLVTLAGRIDELAAAQAFAPEIMGAPLAGAGPLGLADLPALLEACQGKSVIACGPGLWRGPQTCELLGRLLAESRLPAVLDADALNAIAADPSQLEAGSGRVIITPHPGEMSRLARMTTAQVQDERIGTARRFSDEHKVVVVLKGARTVIANTNGATAINPTGNAGMATGGSGDILTGLCAALVAQGVTLGSAACAAVFVHGLAGDRMRATKGMAGLVATDLLEGMTEVWASWGV